MTIPISAFDLEINRKLSVRAHLLAIGVVALLAFGAVTTYTSIRDFSDARDEAREAAYHQARLAATALDGTIEQARDFVARTANDPGIAHVVGSPACVLEGAGSGMLPAGRLDLYGLDGVVTCSSIRNATVPFSDNASQPWIASAPSSGAVVSAPFRDGPSGRLAIAAAAPIFDDAGNHVGGFAQILFLDASSGELSRSFAGPTGYGFAVDAAGYGTVSSTIDPGEEPRPALISGGATVPGAAIDVHASISREVAEAKARAHARRNLLTALITALLLVGPAMLVERRIARPLRRLRQAVEQASRNVDPERLDVDGPSEIVELVGEFNLMMERRKDAEARLSHAALHDDLTGLPNRTLFVDRLRHAIGHPDCGSSSLAVLLVDIDRFRRINDGFGHGAGDRVLVEITERLRAALRPGDTVARFGADVFVVLATDLDSAATAGSIAARVRAALAQPFSVEGTEVLLTASVGISVGGSESTAEDLIRQADSAMASIKRADKHHAVYDDSLGARAIRRLTTEAELRGAVERDELRVLYQPIMDLATGRPAGVEALVRWEHPKLGIVPPSEFIPLAEETGLIVPIGRWMLGKTTEQAARWCDAGTPIRVSVNLSARELAQPDLPDAVRASLALHALEPSMLCIEITESMLMEEDTPEEILAALRAIGVRLSVDDFGTGYSSLAYLRRFPIDEVKIDRQFIKDLHDPGSAAVVCAVIDIARSMGIEAVAEGIESDRELAALREMGCSAGQGFFFARPQPPDAVAKLLASSVLAAEYA